MRAPSAAPPGLPDHLPALCHPEKAAVLMSGHLRLVLPGFELRKDRLPVKVYLDRSRASYFNRENLKQKCSPARENWGGKEGSTGLGGGESCSVSGTSTHVTSSCPHHPPTTRNSSAIKVSPHQPPFSQSLLSTKCPHINPLLAKPYCPPTPAIMFWIILQAKKQKNKKKPL